MKHYTMLLVVTFILSFSIFAQETDSKKTDKINGAEKGESLQSVGDKVRIKDGTTTLLEITNEGSAGSILLPSVGSVLSGSKLYSNGVNLFWGSSQLNGSNGATAINDLSDAKFDGSSLFLGELAGSNNGDDNHNLGFGYAALSLNTTGSYNTAIGELALVNNLTGDNNIAIGNGTLLNSTEGNSNIAIGVDALNSNLKGDNNIAMGNFSLLSNTTGGGNIAIGNEALKLNTTGPLNTAIGAKALLSNKTGQLNTANDVNALLSNTIGDENTANGSFALEKNTEGFYNTSSGSYALAGNTTGYNNTAIGTSALSSNTTGYGNTAVGYASGPSIGSVNLSNSTAIGNAAKVTSSNQVQIGNLLVESIGGYQDWSDLSDGRYKNNIIEDVAGIDFIMGLRPITYNLDVEKLSTKLGEYSRVDKNGNRMQAELSPEMVEARQRKASKREVGFIAQEVEELANNLGFDFSGVEVPENEQSMYRLRYAEFVVPIVKAMQEQQVVITGLESVVARLQIQIEGLKKSK